MPEIPLSAGSKLELLLSLPNFRILPRTLTHLSAYAYCRSYIVHDRGAEGTLVTLGAHAQEGYGTCPVCLFVCLFVCLSVCYHLIVDIVRFYGLPKVRAALF